MKYLLLLLKKVLCVKHLFCVSADTVITKKAGTVFKNYSGFYLEVCLRIYFFTMCPVLKIFSPEILQWYTPGARSLVSIVILPEIVPE